MYDDLSELLLEIAAGEDTHLELKEVVWRGDQPRFANEEGKAQKAIAEVMISMANTEGGVVLFGVRDDGVIIGIDAARRGVLEQWVVNLTRDQCVPPIEPILDWVQLVDAGKTPRLCFKVTVARSRYYVHQTTDGRFLKRQGSHRQPILAEQLGRMLAERRLTLPFEERPAFGATVESLDRERFDSYYQRRFGVTTQSVPRPIEKLLSNLKLAIEIDGALRPTTLGVLLFAERPSQWLSGAYVDIAVYDHDLADGDTRDSLRIDGTIPEQIEQTLRYLRASPMLATRSRKDGGGRVDLPTYSEVALQEAVTNALIHRDYEVTGSQVRLFVFPDRVEFWNPGALFNTLTPENLFAGCQPVRRNQLLAGFLRDYVSPLTGRSYVEARGEGFLNLVRESEQLSHRTPSLIVRGNAVGLTIFAAPPTSSD